MSGRESNPGPHLWEASTLEKNSLLIAIRNIYTVQMSMHREDVPKKILKSINFSFLKKNKVKKSCFPIPCTIYSCGCWWIGITSAVLLAMWPAVMNYLSPDSKCWAPPARQHERRCEGRTSGPAGTPHCPHRRNTPPSRSGYWVQDTTVRENKEHGKIKEDET